METINEDFIDLLLEVANEADKKVQEDKPKILSKEDKKAKKNAYKELDTPIDLKDKYSHTSAFDKNGKMTKEYKRDFENNARLEKDKKAEYGAVGKWLNMNKSKNAIATQGKSDTIVGRKYLEDSIGNKNISDSDATNIGKVLRYGDKSAVDNISKATENKIVDNCIRRHYDERVSNKEKRQELAINSKQTHETINLKNYSEDSIGQLINTLKTIKSKGADFRVRMPNGYLRNIIPGQANSPDCICSIDGRFYVCEEKGGVNMEDAVKLVKRCYDSNIACLAIINNVTQDKMSEYVSNFMKERGIKQSFMDKYHRLISSAEYHNLTKNIQSFEVKQSKNMDELVNSFKPLNDVITALKNHTEEGTYYINQNRHKQHYGEEYRRTHKKAASVNTEIFNY